MKEIEEVRKDLIYLTEKYKLMKIGTVLNLFFKVFFYLLTFVLFFNYAWTVSHEELILSSVSSEEKEFSMIHLFNTVKTIKLFLALFSLTIAVLLSKIRVKRTRIAKILFALNRDVDRLSMPKNNE